MTGIFQIFDRYKAKAYSKNDSRRTRTGDSEPRTIPSYYLVEDDGMARKVPPEVAEQRHARSEASRDSRRSSCADMSEVVVKTLTSPKGSQTGSVQKPHPARLSTDFPNPPALSTHESWLPHDHKNEIGGSNESAINLQNFSSEALTPRLTVPSRVSVDSKYKDGLKLPPRDTRGTSRSASHKDRSRTSVENAKDLTAHFDDARDISRAIMQMREAAHSPYDIREARRHSSAARKDVQRYHSSGDERESDNYRKDGRHYQSSGDERDVHRHHSAGDTRDARRYSSVTESYRELVHEDERDHHRPQFPPRDRDILRSWHSMEGRRIQTSGHVKDSRKYMSSGDEMDNRRNLSSGDEKGGHRLHSASERRENSRNRASTDQTSRRNYLSVDRAGHKHPVGDGYDDLRYESSGEEKVPQRLHSSSAVRREARRHHYHISGDERSNKHHSSKERGDCRRYDAFDAGREGQGFQSSADERGGHRHHLFTKDVYRRQASAAYGSSKHQLTPELNERQKYQSAGEEKAACRHQGSSARGSRNHPSTSSFEGRPYQSSDDDRRGHRFYSSAGDREVGKRHNPSLGTEKHSRNDHSDEDREAFAQQGRTNVRDAGRRHSSVTNADRAFSLNIEEGYRYHSSTEEKQRDRNRSTSREGSRYGSDLDSREVATDFLKIRTRDGHGDRVFDEANVDPDFLLPTALKDVHRRNSSAEGRGDHRRQSSALPKQSASLHLSGDARVSKSKDRESSAGYSRDLPPRSAGSRNTVSPRNLVDIRDLARMTVQARESSQLSSLKDGSRGEPQKFSNVQESSKITVESNSGSFDFREMLRAVDLRDSQWSAEKGRDVSRNSFDGRDPPRTSNVSRISVDSRQYQSSTPRLSVDGRDHLRASSLHSSRASSVDAHVQLRTNSMDSSSGSGEYKRRGPSVVARLMGLAELPDTDTALPSLDKPQVREGKSLQKLLNTTPPIESASPTLDRAKLQLHLSEVAQQMKQVAARLHQDPQLPLKPVQVQQESRPKRKPKIKSRSNSRSRSPPPAPAQLDKDKRALKQHQGHGSSKHHGESGITLPKQPISPKHHQMEGMPNVLKKRSQELSPGDLDQRLHQLRIRNSIQEHRTLQQILEAMHLKGLLHPPQKKHSKPLRVPSLEQKSSRDDVERPLHHLELNPSSSSTSLARNHHKDSQEHLTLEVSVRMDAQEQVDAAPEIDHSGEASIVVMKPAIHHFIMPAHAMKEAESNLETTILSGLETVKEDISNRVSERRTGTIGNLSRSRSLEPPEQRSAEQAAIDDLSFANVMLSWRERIAADAAKKATVEIAEGKPQSRTKGSITKQRVRDSSPLIHESRSVSSRERRVGSPRLQEEFERPSSNSSVENDALIRKIQSDTAHEDGARDEHTSTTVTASKSELLPSAPSDETMNVQEASLDRVPAQVAVLRSKRTTSKGSRSKDKLRALSPGNLQVVVSSSVLTVGNVDTSPLTEDHVQDPCHDLADSKEMVMGTDCKAQKVSTLSDLKSLEDSPRVTPKKRKIRDPAVVRDETVATPAVEPQALSKEVSDSLLIMESSISAESAIGASEDEDLLDAKADDAIIGISGGLTPEYHLVGKDRCLLEEGTCSLGADQLSPVSVLDSPIFQEGFQLEVFNPSPDSVRSSTTEDAGDSIEYDRVAYGHEVEVSTPLSPAIKDISDPLKDIYTKVARSLELGEKEFYRGQSGADVLFITDTKSYENAAKVSRGNQEQERLYVQDILIESGLTDGGSLLTEDPAEIMQFEVFTKKEEELQTEELNRIDKGELDKSEEKRYKESLDRRLIFDCMNEILERKMSPFLNPQPWGAPVVRSQPCGLQLVDEVWDDLVGMHCPATAAYDALYSLLQKDFMQKGFQWLDFSIEIGEVGSELECMLFQQMVEEVVQDLISIKPAKSRQLANPSPAAASSSLALPLDDSEHRRRELLEITRRDLLAWHVQYQQL